MWHSCSSHSSSFFLSLLFLSIMARQLPVFLYDVWTSVPRTRRGHVSDPVSITAHQAPQREEVRWMIRLPSQPDARLTDSDAPEWRDEPQHREQAPRPAWNSPKRWFAASLVLVFTGLDMNIKRFPVPCRREILRAQILLRTEGASQPGLPGSQLDSHCKKIRKTTVEIGTLHVKLTLRIWNRSWY